MSQKVRVRGAVTGMVRDAVEGMSQKVRVRGAVARVLCDVIEGVSHNAGNRRV